MPRDLDALEARFARVPDRGRDGDRRAPATRLARGRSVRERTDRGASAGPARRTLRPIARRCSAGWRCRGPGELAPGADVAATSRGLVRRAAARRPARWPAAIAPPASTRARRGPSPTGSACCSRCPGRPRSAGRRGPPSAAARRAGSPTTPSGRRSASTPGKASSGSTATASRGHARLGAPRLDAIEAGRAARTPPRPIGCWPRPKRPATESTRLRAALAPADAASRTADGPAAEAAGSRSNASARRCAGARSAEQDPPEQRRRRRAVGDDRLEVVAVDEARASRRSRPGRPRGVDRAGSPARPPPGGAPRARCPTSPSSPRSRSRAGSTTGGRGRTWRAPRTPPGSRRRP